MVEDLRKVTLLLDFLDKNIFDPVLEAIPEQYSSERDKKNLQVIQNDIKEERKRFHYCNLTPEEIRNQYFRELYFEVNGCTGKVLEDLELPRFVQLRNKFSELCKFLQL